MAIKEDCTFLKSPALHKLHHQVVTLSYHDTRWGSLTPLQRRSRLVHPKMNIIWQLKFELTTISCYRELSTPLRLLRQNCVSEGLTCYIVFFSKYIFGPVFLFFLYILCNDYLTECCTKRISTEKNNNFIIICKIKNELGCRLVDWLVVFFYGVLPLRIM